MGRQWIWKNRCQNLINGNSSASGGQHSQPLITFGQVCSNIIKDTTENLGPNINVTFAVNNENSRITSPNPHLFLKDANHEQSQGDKLVALSDKL